jgi:hypothetical protein
MKILFLFFFLLSCASPNSNYIDNDTTFNFNKNLSFDEFNQLLIKYAERSSYPDINK